MNATGFMPSNSKAIGVRLLPWALSFFAVSLLFILMLLYEARGLGKPDEEVTVRNIELTLPPPPEPEPPLRTRQPESEALTPSIDLIGAGEGPALSYSDNPKLAMLSLQKVQKPEFDTESLDLRKTLSVDFPIFEVQELDKAPRLISNNRISFPNELARRGINRIETQVEIIIDQHGKAFVRKIIEPGYPEMIEVIRKAINDSRFTVPTKDGLPVQAVYLYTLVFINRI